MAEPQAQAPTASSSFPPMRVGVFACILLVIGVIVSLIDRQILSLMIEPIQTDLGISDTQFSLLQGFAFMVLYSGAGLIFGYAVDRMSRRNIIIFCLIGWSMMTILCGLARNFWQLFGARVGVGIGEAGLHPAAYSLLCDFFAPRHRGRAFGVIGYAASVGSAVSFLGGGMLYTWLATHPIPDVMGTLAPWQQTFIIAGLPGFLVAALFLLLREPARQTGAGPAATHAGSGQVGLWQFMRAKRRILVPLLLHYTLFQMCAYAFFGWTPAFYMRVHGATIAESGLIVGAALMIGGLGSLLTGYLGDRWIARGARGGRLRSTFLGVVIGVPAFAVCFLVDSLALSIIAGVIGWATICITLTAAPIVLGDIVESHLRGRMFAVYGFVCTVLGSVFGPLCVALLTDGVFGDRASVNLSLVIVMLSAMLAGAWLAWRILDRYDAEIRDTSNAALAH